MTLHRADSRGFTLVEVLVALAIISVALVAGMRALSMGARGAQAMHERSLALQAVSNRLAELRLAQSFPVPGAGAELCPQGPLTFSCEQQVQTTVNANFRLVTVRARLTPRGPVLAELSGVLSRLP